jgi:hypothetical protein
LGGVGEAGGKWEPEGRGVGGGGQEGGDWNVSKRKYIIILCRIFNNKEGGYQEQEEDYNTL